MNSPHGGDMHRKPDAFDVYQSYCGLFLYYSEIFDLYTVMKLPLLYVRHGVFSTVFA